MLLFSDRINHLVLFLELQQNGMFYIKIILLAFQGSYVILC